MTYAGSEHEREANEFRDERLVGPPVIAGSEGGSITSSVKVTLTRDEWEVLVLLRWLDFPMGINDLVSRAAREFVEAAKEQSAVKAALAVRKHRKEPGASEQERKQARDVLDARMGAVPYDPETGEIGDSVEVRREKLARPVPPTRPNPVRKGYP